ncbi:MAG: replication protein [Giesbergeria sp.]|uniref:helix-turn-helix domain-containing protein n=1 Tax=Giesbergeria sp. TaxID=2818473 RepID=UPI002606B5F3|nr:replication protein [Giesbergeria sp.]MDD2610952.1 replication protein [Giesbergeria sp.]
MYSTSFASFFNYGNKKKQMAQAQLKLFSPHDEAQCYLDSSRQGFFSILVAPSLSSAKRQQSYRLAEMPTVLSGLDKTRDTWLSQAEFFRPNRRVVNLARIGLLFADIDSYRQDWAQGRSPERLATDVLFFCREEGLPPPSILVFSGRGLQAKWLIEGALPRQALPRWNACQRALVDRLAFAGADPAARDASRVLRLINTVNTKSGEICRVVHVEPGEDGQPIRYGFEWLAETLLPIGRWDLESKKKARKASSELKLVPGYHTGNLRPLNGRQLAWSRLEDLRLLAELRGGVHEGERMLHLFWRLNFLLLSGATHSGGMFHEAVALARELDPSWGYSSSDLTTLYRKAQAYEAGERVEFNGKQFAPLYTPRNATLISIFGITDQEQRSLSTVISQEMALERRRERDRKRDEARRRAVGEVDRQTYIEVAQNKKAQALVLRAQGLTVRAIAARLGISKTAAADYVAGG